jgi:Rrf2 family protein
MNFSKTTEYALQIMSLMAMDETRLYTADDIFRKLNIPYRYLRRLMTTLTRSKLIISEQGKYGGYRFCRPIADITLMDIVSSVEEDRLADNCFFGFGVCSLMTACIMHEKWTSIREKMKEALNQTTLMDIKHNGPITIRPDNNN